MTKQEMIGILEENKDLIENNEFQKFYNNIKYDDRHYFTDLFLKSRINPLEHMTKIPEYYAYNLNNLKGIKIPNNITNIGDAAFFGCSNLKNIEIPSSVVSINGLAFTNCGSLKRIEIPTSVTSIRFMTFSICRNLETIIIPASLTYIGRNAFELCANLKNVYYEGSEDDWNKIEIDQGNKMLNKATIHYNSKT